MLQYACSDEKKRLAFPMFSFQSLESADSNVCSILALAEEMFPEEIVK